MKSALWIIAICQVIRLAQNMAQLMMTRTAMKGDKKHQDAALRAFIKSLNRMDGVDETEDVSDAVSNAEV